MEQTMTVRAYTEEMELNYLSPYAARSALAERERPEEDCPVRTRFQRDRDRILHSKAFRRLKHKTQVYIAPVGDHYRTRMTHSLEVAQICRTIGRGLRLNEDLIEAIALGHDVGHTPFGHVGEEALNGIVGSFEHNQQSVRVLKVLTENGRGLNLTHQVLDGILNHTGAGTPCTLEGQIVKTGDRIGYLCHDYDDALRAGLLNPEDLPDGVRRTLGDKPGKMITSMVMDMIQTSEGQREIKQSPAVKEAMQEFRRFMFEQVYRHPSLMDERRKGSYIIHELFKYYRHNINALPDGFLETAGGDGVQAVTDYISGLTDNYAIDLFASLFIPKN